MKINSSTERTNEDIFTTNAQTLDTNNTKYNTECDTIHGAIK